MVVVIGKNDMCARLLSPMSLLKLYRSTSPFVTSPGTSSSMI
jgi:hypothetical protein